MTDWGFRSLMPWMRLTAVMIKQKSTWKAVVRSQP